MIILAPPPPSPPGLCILTIHGARFEANPTSSSSRATRCPMSKSICFLRALATEVAATQQSCHRSS
eukprot:9471060-Pyramimonas_sp.AAC.1